MLPDAAARDEPPENPPDETDPTDASRRWMPFPIGVVLLAAAALTLLTASRVYLSLDIKGFPETAGAILAAESLRWGLWVPLVPLVVTLDRRRGFGARPPWAAAAVHLAGFLAIFAGHSAVMTAAGHAAGWYFILDSPRATFLIQLVHEAATVALVYATVVSARHLRRHLRERERRRIAHARLETRLARERLRNLQMQLHPHFLFNTLHALGGLIRDGERDVAVKTVSDLADLLRRSLSHGQRQEITLEEELDFIRSYLEIQAARYGSRLETRIDADPAARGSLVPHLVLQPLVENAIRHGTSRIEGTGRVDVEARVEDGRLVLEVRDNGPGPAAGDDDEGAGGDGGLGLENTRARLAELYGGDGSLRLDRNGGEGTTARIEIPLRPAGEAASGG